VDALDRFISLVFALAALVVVCGAFGLIAWAVWAVIR